MDSPASYALSCSRCTYKNHPDLSECEACDYPLNQPRNFIDESSRKRVLFTSIPPEGIEATCPRCTINAQSGYDDIKGLCHVCGYSLECLDTFGPAAKRQRTGKCYSCHKEGHWSSNCPEKKFYNTTKQIVCLAPKTNLSVMADGNHDGTLPSKGDDNQKSPMFQSTSAEFGIIELLAARLENRSAEYQDVLRTRFTSGHTGAAKHPRPRGTNISNATLRQLVQEYRFFSSCAHITQRNSADENWSCGYRNIQMLCSALLSYSDLSTGRQHPSDSRTPGLNQRTSIANDKNPYKAALFSGSGEIPDIHGIQAWIEKAWQAGFDTEGRDQLGGSILGTTTWIGASECVALLRYFGVRAIVVDFHHSQSQPQSGHHDHNQHAAAPDKTTSLNSITNAPDTAKGAFKSTVTNTDADIYTDTGKLGLIQQRTEMIKRRLHFFKAAPGSIDVSICIKHITGDSHPNIGVNNGNRKRADGDGGASAMIDISNGSSDRRSHGRRERDVRDIGATDEISDVDDDQDADHKYDGDRGTNDAADDAADDDGDGDDAGGDGDGKKIAAATGKNMTKEKPITDMQRRIVRWVKRYYEVQASYSSSSNNNNHSNVSSVWNNNTGISASLVGNTTAIAISGSNNSSSAAGCGSSSSGSGGKSILHSSVLNNGVPLKPNSDGHNMIKSGGECVTVNAGAYLGSIDAHADVVIIDDSDDDDDDYDKCNASKIVDVTKPLFQTTSKSVSTLTLTSSSALSGKSPLERPLVATVNSMIQPAKPVPTVNATDNGPSRIHGGTLDADSVFPTMKSFCPPLFYQHQGHSRTIIGYQVTPNVSTIPTATATAITANKATSSFTSSSTTASVSAAAGAAVRRSQKHSGSATATATATVTVTDTDTDTAHSHGQRYKDACLNGAKQLNNNKEGKQKNKQELNEANEDDLLRATSLLVFDPSSDGRKISTSLKNGDNKWGVSLKRGLHTISHPDYQIVYIAHPPQQSYTRDDVTLTDDLDCPRQHHHDHQYCSKSSSSSYNKGNSSSNGSSSGCSNSSNTGDSSNSSWLMSPEERERSKIIIGVSDSEPLYYEIP